MSRLRYPLFMTASLALILAGLGCAPIVATPPPPPVVAYIPKFQFPIPNTAVPGSAKTTIAIVQATPNNQAFNTFNSRFVQDLQNVLVARGYNVKGPFPTIDDMTYSDKKDSDFILRYGLSGNYIFTNVKTTQSADESQLPPAEEKLIWNGTYTSLLGLPVKNINGQAKYFSGNFIVSSKINLELDESLSGEKLWMKTIDISANPEPFDTSAPHAIANNEDPTVALEKTTYMDQGMTNALNKALNSIYNNAFTAIWNQLDPMELRDLKKQADEIKSKKRF